MLRDDGIDGAISNRMKAFLSILLLVSLAVAQEPVCFTYDGIKTVPIACSEVPRMNQWRTLPPTPKRSWVSRHKIATVLLFLGAGVGVGIGIERATRQSCGHYEYGQSGVNVNCPKEAK